MLNKWDTLLEDKSQPDITATVNFDMNKVTPIVNHMEEKAKSFLDSLGHVASTKKNVEWTKKKILDSLTNKGKEMEGQIQGVSQGGD